MNHSDLKSAKLNKTLLGLEPVTFIKQIKELAAASNATIESNVIYEPKFVYFDTSSPNSSPTQTVAEQLVQSAKFSKQSNKSTCKYSCLFDCLFFFTISTRKAFQFVFLLLISE